MNVCTAIIFIFSDAVWQPAAQLLGSELSAPNVCIRHEKLWVQNYSSHWGEAVYFERIRQRVPLVHAFMSGLPLDNNRWVALFDADVTVHRNVTARITNLFQTTQSHLIAQQEWPCKTAPLQLCVNGGVWAVRRSAQGLALLARVARLMQQLHIPDQDAFDIVAADEAVHYLDRYAYANGFTIQRDNLWTVQRAHLMHVNWMQSTECKLRWLRHLRAHRFHSTVVLAKGDGVAQSRCGV